MRPNRQPCSSLTGLITDAPAASASLSADSGSSTISSILDVAPPTDSGLKFPSGGDSSYDVVVVGGGVAGLSAALGLARARRSVIVMDDGHPRNAPAARAHGYLTRDGAPPLELLSIGRLEVRAYGGEILEGTVTSITGLSPGGFRVETSDGRAWHARRGVVTTGLVDELTNIPGLRRHWGLDLAHCP